MNGGAAGTSEVWEAVVDPVLAAGPAIERRSRYADKPALVLDGREIAHFDAPDRVDLRITRSGWATVAARFAADPAVRRDPTRRDWLELVLTSPADVARLHNLITAAVAANR